MDSRITYVKDEIFNIITSQPKKWLHRGRYTQNLYIHIEFHPIQNIQKRKNNHQQNPKKPGHNYYNNWHNRRKKISPKEQTPQNRHQCHKKTFKIKNNIFKRTLFDSKLWRRKEN